MCTDDGKCWGDSGGWPGVRLNLPLPRSAGGVAGPGPTLGARASWAPESHSNLKSSGVAWGLSNFSLLGQSALTLQPR